MRLLHIDSSISGDQSVSRSLSAAIVARLQAEHSDLEITYHDLAADPLPQQSPAIQLAKLKALHAVGAPSGDVNATIANGDDVIEEFAKADAALNAFLAADIVVVGAPMYNFSVPSQLKTWIDWLAAPGKTFRYTETGVEGLATGKRLYIASARGGHYAAPSPMAAMDHQESYLTGFLTFIGIGDPIIIRAEGVNYGPEQRQAALDSALGQAAALAA